MEAWRARLGLAAILHPLEEGGERAPEILARAAEALRGAGIEIVEAPAIIADPRAAARAGRAFYDARVPAVALLVVTWSADPLVLDMLEEARVPLVAWTFPGMHTGSMCGGQQIGCVLAEIGHPFRFVLGDAGDPAAAASVARWARAASLAFDLRRMRLGLLGYRIAGMTEVCFDELELKARLGPRIIHFGVSQLEEAARAIPEEEALAAWEPHRHRAGRVDVPRDVLAASMRAYLVLRRWAEEEGLAGIAVECYPDLMGRLCLAASLLADEGIALGCEGDVNATVAMAILSRLTGGPVHNADPLGVDRAEGSVVFSHCGAGSMRLAPSPESVQIAAVRLAGGGACVRFPGKPGRVTLANLVGRRGTCRVGIFTGEAVPGGMVFAGNPTRVILDGGLDPWLEIVAREGLGHHWIVGYGDVAGEVEELCRLAGIRAVRGPAP